MSTEVEDEDQFKRQLLRLQDELRQVEAAGNEAAQVVELDQSRVGRVSRMDALQVQAMAVETRNRRRLQLQRIDGALQRIEKGSYGSCIKCKEAIAPKRLAFDPTFLVCIDCARG